MIERAIYLDAAVWTVNGSNGSQYSMLVYRERTSLVELGERVRDWTHWISF